MYSVNYAAVVLIIFNNFTIYLKREELQKYIVHACDYHVEKKSWEGEVSIRIFLTGNIAGWLVRGVRGGVPLHRLDHEQHQLQRRGQLLPSLI